MPIIRLSPSGPELAYPAADSGKVLTVGAGGNVTPQAAASSGGIPAASSGGIPAPAASRMIFVSPPSPAGWGSDTTGDGSEGKPYATIAHAQSMVTTPSLARIWDIVLFPGTYVENVALKVFTRLVGWDPSLSDAVGNPAFIDGSLFLAPGAEWQTAFAMAGVANITVSGSITLDYWTLLSLDGRVGFTRCNLSGAIILWQNAGNSTDFQACVLDVAADFTQTGGRVAWYGTAGNNSNQHMIIGPALNSNAVFEGYGGGWAGDVTATQNAIDIQSCNVNLYGFRIGQGVSLIGTNLTSPIINGGYGATLENPLLSGGSAVGLSQQMRIFKQYWVPGGTVVAASSVTDVMIVLTDDILGADNIGNLNHCFTLIGQWAAVIAAQKLSVTFAVINSGTQNEIHVLIECIGPGFTTAGALYFNWYCWKQS